MYRRFRYRNILKVLLTAAIFAGNLTPSASYAQAVGNIPVARAEKIYVHLDKELYTAGEIAWFKIYAMDPVSHQPVNFSKVSYVEIIDSYHKPVVQAKIEMTAYGGEGSFYLPLSLATGGYTVRAYTNLTRREGSDHFFEKNIIIVNTVKFIPTAPGAVNQAPPVIAFFPEGGQLVSELETVVAFKVSDAVGKGRQGNGWLVNAAGDTLQQIAADSRGMGSFRLKPATGSNYKVLFRLADGGMITGNIPASSTTGYVMSVTAGTDERLGVIVNAKPAGNNGQGEEIFLVASKGNQTLFTMKSYLVYGQPQSFYTLKSALPEGVTTLTLFNAASQPVAERLYFRRPSQEAVLRITTAQPSFALRSPVTLNVNYKTSDVSDTLFMSASVFRFDSLKNIGADNIITHTWFGGELQGNIEDAAYYLSDAPGVADATDLLMLTHGWRKFRQNPGPSLPAEFKNHIITARVTESGDKPATGVICYLTVPTSPPGLYVARSDDKGYVRFTVDRFYGPGDIIIQPVTDGSAKYKVYVQTPFSTDSLRRPAPAFTLRREQEQQLLQKNLAMQVQNIYSAAEIRKFSLPMFADTLAFYGKPEFNYWLDDYKRFTTMEEVLREYVSPVTVIMKNGRQKLRIYDELNRKIYDDYMLVLLDGVPLKDPDKIFEYDPLKIRRIQVVPRNYVYGSAYFTGIASFETYSGKFDGFELDPSIVAVDYEGLQLKREFYSPVYETAAQMAGRRPDMRTTLQWTPQMALNANVPAVLSFYTSDVPGSYVVIAEGVSAKGKLVSVMGSFEVK